MIQHLTPYIVRTLKDLSDISPQNHVVFSPTIEGSVTQYLDASNDPSDAPLFVISPDGARFESRVNGVGERLLYLQGTHKRLCAFIASVHGVAMGRVQAPIPLIAAAKALLMSPPTKDGNLQVDLLDDVMDQGPHAHPREYSFNLHVITYRG